MSCIESDPSNDHVAEEGSGKLLCLVAKSINCQIAEKSIPVGGMFLEIFCMSVAYFSVLEDHMKCAHKNCGH